MALLTHSSHFAASHFALRSRFQATPSARITGGGSETVVDFIHKASLAKSGRCAMVVHVHANRETVR